MAKAPKPHIRTRAQARAFIKKVRICGIFADVEGQCLWNAVDLPHRQPGDKGWGQKVTAIWTWKDELPALYPDEFFYGKVPGGNAALMTIDYLSAVHYPQHHRPIAECSPLAQALYRKIKLDPLTTAQLRRELGMTQRPERTQHDKALAELQTTLNIVRRNGPKDKNDTWIPFREKHLDVAESRID